MYVIVKDFIFKSFYFVLDNSLKFIHVNAFFFYLLLFCLFFFVRLGVYFFFFFHMFFC